MTEKQFETLWELIAEMEHLAKNTAGRASVILADTAHEMRKAAASLETEGLISPQS